MENNKLFQKILFVIFIVVIILLVIVIIDTEKDFKKTNYVIVDNASTFFTIDGCANKYIHALSTKNTKNIMALLDPDYIKKTDLSEYNVIDRLGFNSDYTFTSKKIYQTDINSKIVKYYIFGLLEKDVLDEYSVGENYYLIVNINKKNMTYTVTPYDGKVFIGDNND